MHIHVDLHVLNIHDVRDVREASSENSAYDSNLCLLKQSSQKLYGRSCVVLISQHGINTIDRCCVVVAMTGTSKTSNNVSNNIIIVIIIIIIQHEMF